MPRQLPPAPARFVGRVAELDRLTAQFDASARTGGVLPICALAGAGGIGKTWLALQWAHLVADRFPDGQLYVDLRGFSPEAAPVDPAVATRGFLDAFGVDPTRIPADLQAQAALFRSLVAGRRMLIVLDNAATTEQVTPLLPGGGQCTVIVTSRRTLTTLVSRHGAHHLHLDPLTAGDAHALLAEWLGPERIAAEPDAAADLIGFCRGFALALGLIAGRAHTRPTTPLAQAAAELRDLGLDALDDDDHAASLPAVLSWSFDALTGEQQQVFGLLGIAPGPDITLNAAAGLIDLPAGQAKRVLRGLEEVSFLDQDATGRYAMHDLIRAYASQTARHLAAGVREAALRRIIDFYTHTAYSADRLLEPHRVTIRLDEPVAGGQPLALADSAAALAWFDREHACLLAAQQSAAVHGWYKQVWWLAWALRTFHVRRGHRHDQLAVWEAALEATTRLPDDPTAVSHVKRLLGRAYTNLERHAEAIGYMYQALALAERHHDTVGQAHAHHQLAVAWERSGDDHRALDHATRGLGLFRSLGEPIWEANALNQVGWFAARVGDYDSAREHCQAALHLHQQHHDNLNGEAATLDSLGYIDFHSDRHQDAIDHYRQALALLRDLGHTYRAAETYERIGRPYLALGRHEQARAAWTEALRLYRDQGRDDGAARVREQLRQLGRD